MPVAAGGALLPIVGLCRYISTPGAYGTGRVDRAIGPYVVALALGGRRPRQARELAGRLSACGAPVSDELRGLLDDRVSRAENDASLVVVLGILVLMVFK